MRIRTVGGGPPLVMLHGWAMHCGVFGPLIERLREHFTLHLVDLPGHGLNRDSEQPLEVASVAAAIVAATPPAPWLGWSLGGLVALQAAQAFPRHVGALVMLCASPRFVRAPDWPEGMDPAVFEGFARELARDYRATIDRFLLLEAQGSEHLREDVRTLRAEAFALGEPSPARLAEGLEVLQTCDLRAGLGAMPVPSLWIAGRRDRLVYPQAMQAAAGAASGRFLRIEHGGHAPFLGHADEVANALRGFLAQVGA